MKTFSTLILPIAISAIFLSNPFTSPSQTTFKKHVLTTSFYQGTEVHACDIDQDGDFDIIGATCMSSTLAWWDNDGNTNFTPHLFNEPFTQTFSVVHMAYASSVMCCIPAMEIQYSAFTLKRRKLCSNWPSLRSTTWTA